MQVKTYRAYVGGFFDYFETLDDLKTWVNNLRSQYNLKGETLQIYRGEIFDNVWVWKNNNENFRKIIID